MKFPKLNKDMREYVNMPDSEIYVTLGLSINKAWDGTFGRVIHEDDKGCILIQVPAAGMDIEDLDVDNIMHWGTMRIPKSSVKEIYFG